MYFWLCWVFVVTRPFSSCGEWGLLSSWVRRLCLLGRAGYQGGQASAAEARGLSSCSSRALDRWLSNCGTQIELLRGTWYLPGPGIEAVSPALTGVFFTTEPPRKP